MSSDLFSAVIGRLSIGDFELLPLPEVVAELLVLARSPQVDFASLERVVARDPALAAHVLRAASAPVFAASHATTIREAILRIGTKQLIRIALAVRLASLYQVSRFDGISRRIWAHARLTGVYAASLAPRWGLDTEEAFLGGLLHSIGKPALLRLIEVESRKLESVAPRAMVLEWLREWHVRVGVEMARAWDFHEQLIASIRYYRSAEPPEPHASMALVVGVSSELAGLAATNEAELRDRLGELTLVGALDLEVEALLAWLDLEKLRAQAGAMGLREE